MNTPGQPWVAPCVITASRWVRLCPTSPPNLPGTCAAPIIPVRAGCPITYLGLATHSGGFTPAPATP
jgi:hypothetical protein